jgi:hypothetical protein
MPKIVIVHKVVDLDRWLSYKQERVEQLAPFGTDITDHVAVDGSKTVSVTANISDVAAFQSVMASPPPELAAAMDRHGVIPPLAAYVEK